MRLSLLFPVLLISSSYSDNLPLHQLEVPQGFSVELYAAPVVSARSLCRGDKGTVFVGSADGGRVYAIVPDQKSALGTRVVTVMDGLNSPNGVACKDGALYVAEIHRILRFDQIEKTLNYSKKSMKVIAELPKERHHGLRFIRFGPDGKLYVGIGAPCNVCLTKNPNHATIMRMNPDGSEFEVYASGVRNTVGFDWDPVTQKLWFTDNGRDWLGDNTPPDKINYAPVAGLHYGFPYYHGRAVADPQFGKLRSYTDFVFPAFELPAHVAPLDLSFYSGRQFPAPYRNQFFVVEHGSWNRSSKVGYQIMAVELSDDRTRVKSVKPFIKGWLQGERIWGRPVALLTMEDGSLLVSDDYAGVIYRVRYQGTLVKK